MLIAPSVSADPGGRLIASGGVSSVEGAGGGGLVPWAITGTYATAAELDVALAVTDIQLRDFELQHASVMINWHNRLELSVARNRFDLQDLGVAVNHDDLNLTIVGVKWRVLGDAVFDADNWIPQFAVGAEYKELNVDDFDQLVSTTLGAERRFGVDYYLAFSKLFFAAAFGRNVVVNLTARSSEANQFGLLGFGGNQEAKRRMFAEVSIALLLTDSVAVGVEYRDKPDQLVGFKEQAASDIFLAWFINKQCSLTLARVDLGNIALIDNQTGTYASLQWVF